MIRATELRVERQENGYEDHAGHHREDTEEADAEEITEPVDTRPHHQGIDGRRDRSHERGGGR